MTDRYETSRLVAERAIVEGGVTTWPIVATGRKLPDALAGGPLAAHNGGVLFLSDGPGGVQDSRATAWLERHATDRVVIEYLGGPSALADGSVR